MREFSGDYISLVLDSLTYPDSCPLLLEPVGRSHPSICGRWYHGREHDINIVRSIFVRNHYLLSCWECVLCKDKKEQSDYEKAHNNINPDTNIILLGVAECYFA